MHNTTFNQNNFLRSNHCCYCNRPHCLLSRSNTGYCCSLHSHPGNLRCYHSHHGGNTYYNYYSYYCTTSMYSMVQIQNYLPTFRPIYSYYLNNSMLNYLSIFHTMLSLHSSYSSYCNSSCPIPNNSSPICIHSSEYHSQLCCTAEL